MHICFKTKANTSKVSRPSEWRLLHFIVVSREDEQDTRQAGPALLSTVFYIFYIKQMQKMLFSTSRWHYSKILKHHLKTPKSRPGLWYGYLTGSSPALQSYTVTLQFWTLLPPHPPPPQPLFNLLLTLQKEIMNSEQAGAKTILPGSPVIHSISLIQLPEDIRCHGMQG